MIVKNHPYPWYLKSRPPQKNATFKAKAWSWSSSLSMGGCHRHRVLLSQKKSKIPIVVKLDHFPKVRGKNKKIFKLPPPSRWRGWWFLDGDTTWAKQSPDPSDGAGIERWESNVANVAWGPIWSMYGTVDGSEIRRSPVDMVNIRLFIWFYTSQAVQHFFHQQYICLHLYIDTWFLGTWILWVRGEADSQNSLCVCVPSGFFVHVSFGKLTWRWNKQHVQKELWCRHSRCSLMYC